MPCWWGRVNRTNPNGRGTQNYLFALQDRKIKTQTFAASGNPAPDPITLADLVNVESDPFANANSEAALLSAQLALGQSRGWYLPLDLSEKSVSAPTLISGIAYFTTFSSCQSREHGCMFRGGRGFSVRTVTAGGDAVVAVQPGFPTARYAPDSCAAARGES